MSLSSPSESAFLFHALRPVVEACMDRFRLTLAPHQTVRAEQLFTIRPKGGLKMIVRPRNGA